MINEEEFIKRYHHQIAGNTEVPIPENDTWYRETYEFFKSRLDALNIVMVDVSKWKELMEHG